MIGLWKSFRLFIVLKQIRFKTYAEEFKLYSKGTQLVAMPTSLPRMVLKISWKENQQHFSYSIAWETEARENLASIRPQQECGKEHLSPQLLWSAFKPQRTMMREAIFLLGYLCSTQEQTDSDWHSIKPYEMKCYWYSLSQAIPYVRLFLPEVVFCMLSLSMPVEWQHLKITW